MGRGQPADRVTVNLTLAPPPQNNRRVRVIGSMHIVDDETFGDEIGDFPILREVDLNPVQTQQQITISECVGDEVRVELRISLRLLADNVSVETIVQTSLFEGTACDTDDLEDSDSRSVVVAEDSGQSVSIHLESEGVGGGDTADIDLNIVNQRQN